MIRRALLATVLATLPSIAFGQTGLDSQEFADEINGLLNQAVNAVTLFSSQQNVSSGYLRFKTDEELEKDSKLEVLRLPVTLPLAADPEDELRPYVRVLLGYLKFTESVAPVDSIGIDDFSRIYTYTTELGVGFEFEPLENLVITPDFGVTYSRIENRYDYNNVGSQEIAPLIDGEVFNWDLDVITYAPELAVEYTVMVGDVAFTPKSSVTYLINDSIGSSSDLIDVDSETTLFQNGLEVLVPLGLSLMDSPLGLRGFGFRSDVSGAARDGLEFSHFYELGSQLVFDVRSMDLLAEEVHIGFAYTFTDDVEGLRIGFGIR